MNRPGQWPVEQPVDLEALEPDTGRDTQYAQMQKERALHEMVLDSIRHDLEQQPSPVTVLTAARDWCTRITATAEAVAQAKRRTAA